ncbi:antibiotic biosynthesis monooxygenase [Sphingomonas sp. AOB5]|uniref:antibiotic biosynthesis monooxygenase family protein n=1 Tax=Sphingomonas sp. AOB5 TaxID=3034017 RepID=UPI0023F95480|nr:antibiotic biosynthesis monooxygenase family protein [Sphingomonas sp. AOB5]MDF7776329.1 antibiotic biosynthesis monooxygenase [Sphingomonas sp. AOB5]
MPIILSATGVVTQINLFTVPEGGQAAMIEQLARGVAVAREVPGWRSASLHRSLDGTRVVNYAQSDSLDAALAVIERLKATGMIGRNRDFGDAHPGLYEVVRTLE